MRRGHRDRIIDRHIMTLHVVHGGLVVAGSVASAIDLAAGHGMQAMFGVLIALLASRVLVDLHGSTRGWIGGAR